MKLTDKDIENLFKEKAASSSFKYDNAYWKEMEAMLPKNNGKGFLWMATSFLFLGLVAFSFLRTNEITSENNAILVAEESSPVSAESINNNSSLEKNATSITETSSIDPPNTEDKIIKKEVQYNSEQHSIAQNTAPSTKNSIQHSLKELNQSTNTTAQQNLSDVSLLNTTDSPLIVSEEASVEQMNAIDDLNSKKEQIASPSKEIPSSLSLKELSLFPNEEFGIAPYYGTNKMSLRSQLYIQGVGGVSQSMVTPSNQLSYSFGAGVGVQMNKGRFTFNTGLNGIWSFHDDLILTRQAKIYGFGSEVVNYQIKYKEIFSLEADLSIGYQFSNHIIRVGVRPSYIVGTKVGYKELKSDESTTENFYGYHKGVSLWGIKPMIGYTYLINQKISVGINIGMQLMPLIDGQYISGQNRSFPIDGQIYIRRTLHLRK